MALAIWRQLWSSTPRNSISDPDDECPPYSTIAGVCGCNWCRYPTKFDDIGVDEIEPKIIELVKNIWFASYEHKLTPCILETVRACIKACKESESTRQLLTKYFYDMEDMSLAIFVILHSLAEVDARSSLLELIIHELPMTLDIRDRLYLACVRTGSNFLFQRVSQAHRENRASEASSNLTSEYIHYHLKLKFGLFGKLNFSLTRDGFQVGCFIPNVLQRVHCYNSIFVYYAVARDQIWGLDLDILNGYLGLRLNALRPSRAYGTLSADITMWSDKLQKRRSGSKCERVTTRTKHVDVEKDVNKIDYNNTIAFWGFSKKDTDRLIRAINKDGSCYLQIHVKINLDRYK